MDGPRKKLVSLLWSHNVILQKGFGGKERKEGTLKYLFLVFAP